MGTSYGRKGQTPVIPWAGQRFRCNMISTIANRGQLAFMVFRGRFNTPVFLRFLRRLPRQPGAGSSSSSIDTQCAWRPRSSAGRRNTPTITGSFPAKLYSPNLNPDEFPDNNVKANALGRRRPRDQEEPLTSVRSYLGSTQRQPVIVPSYFEALSVRYATSHRMSSIKCSR